MKKILILFVFLLSFTGISFSQEIINPDETYILLALVADSKDSLEETAETKKDIDLSKIYGKIKFVTSNADYKVKVVDSFPDLKVKTVDSFADSVGKWKIVDSFPDFKIQIVDSFPDFTIKFVDSFPGVN